MLAWLLGFFYFTLLVGMTPMEVAAALMLLTGFWELIRRRWSFYGTQVWVFFLFWIIAVLLSFLYNQKTGEELKDRIFEFKWIIFFFLMTYFLIRSSFDEKVSAWAFIPIFIACTYSVVLSFVGIDPIKNEMLSQVWSDGLYRSGGLYSHPMTLAHVYAMIFCWFFGSFISSYHFKQKVWRWLLLSSVFLAAAVIFSFTRGAWIGLISAVIIMAWLYNKIFGFMTIILTSVLGFFCYEFWPSFTARISQSFSTTGYDFERIWIWKANFEIFKSSPWFGVGYGENSKLLPEYLNKIGAPAGVLVSHAHNQYLHLLAGIGIFGLIAYLLLIGYFLFISYRLWRTISFRSTFYKGLSLGLIGAQIVFIIGGLSESNFEHSKVKYVIVATWAMVIWLCYEFRIFKKYDIK